MWPGPVKAVGATLTIVAIWFAAPLSDRFGRTPVMFAGMLAGTVLAHPIIRGFAIGLFLATASFRA